jgi:RNA polymerase sigma factor (sigma-70 family)
LKKLPKYSDEEMIAGLVSRNKDVLRAYYYFFYSGIRHFVRENSGNDQDARDLFQDIILVLFQKARHPDFILCSSLSTYIFSICRPLWFKEIRRRRLLSVSEVHEEYPDEDNDVLEIAEYNERLEIYRYHFEKLSIACQKVLALFLEGLSISQITARLGYKSDQHTKNRRYRCKMALIKQIRNFYGIESAYGYDEADRSLSGRYAG